MFRLTSWAALALTCVIPAQGSFVSPVALTSTEGISQNTFPFNAPFHYMQVHGDMRSKVLVIKGMSFRRDGKTTTNGALRTLEIEVNFGASDFAQTSSTYASNFTGTPTQVFKRGKVNFPAWPAPVSSPSPWDAQVPFNNGTYLHLGTADLAWEWITHSTTSTGYYLADATSAGDQRGTYTRLGTGCRATGQSRTMLATSYFAVRRATNQLLYAATCSYGTASASGAILVGTSNPNLPLPICGPATLYTDALLTIPVVSSTSGSLNTGAGLTIPFNASYAGLKAYTQIYTADANLGPLPVAVSNGVESVVPAAPPPLSLLHRIYARNSPTATSGTLAKNNGLVTRFDL